MQDTTTPINLDQLREAFLHAEESQATAIIAILMSTTLLVTVLVLVRRRVLREEYTPIWMAVSIFITLVSLRLDLLRVVTRWIGAWTPSSAIFFLGEVFLVLICLNYAVRLSKYAGRIKDLAQDAAILRARVDELEARARENAS